MKKAISILLVMVLTLVVYWYFSGTNMFTAPPRQAEVKPLRFQKDSLERQIGQCTNAGENCLVVKMTYPVAVDGRDSVREKINNFIRQTLAGSVLYSHEEPAPASAQRHIDSLIADLAEEYRRYQQEMPEIVFGWAFETTGATVFKNDSLAVLDFTHYSYTGGAHPNTYSTMVNFNLNTGRQLSYRDVVGDTTAFKKVAESVFRESYGIGPEEDLSKMGFWFPGDQFTLPQHFHLRADGLHLQYDPYEIGPYAMGPISILVNKNEYDGWALKW